jgi:hypothetical protein
MDRAMEQVLWAVTIWGLWSCWLVCQFMRAPALLTQTAAALLVLELLALGVRWFDCDAGGCGDCARAAGSVATFDVPGLAALLVAAATLHAWRRSAGR